MGIADLEEMTTTIDFVYFGRNDNYHADYLQRTNACLNYNLRSIHQAGLMGKVRLLFVDWASEQPLTEKLAVKDIYSEGIRLLYLDSTFLGKYDFKVEKINPSFAGNIGFYKSNADYCFYGGSDLIATPRDFQNLYLGVQEILGKQDTKLLMAERSFLNPNFFSVPRSFEDVDYYLESFYFEPERISGAGGGAALIGGKRKTLVEWGGLNEACSGWGGNDIELFIRATKYGSSINLSKRYGVYFHKFPYSRSGKRHEHTSNYKHTWPDYLGLLVENRKSVNFNLLDFSSPMISSEDLKFPVQQVRKSSKFKLIHYLIKIYSSHHVQKEYKLGNLISEFITLPKISNIKKLLELNRIEAVVLVGDFNLIFLLVVWFILNGSIIVFWYSLKKSNNRIAVRFMSISRLFLDSVQNNLCGTIKFICPHNNFKVSDDDGFYLKDKMVIVFSNFDDGIHYNILDEGDNSLDLNDLLPIVGMSNKLDVNFQPVLILVLFIVKIKITVEQSKLILRRYIMP
jgi:hypothetical protein